jgi:hypothetical protein
VGNGGKMSPNPTPCIQTCPMRWKELTLLLKDAVAYIRWLLDWAMKKGAISRLISEAQCGTQPTALFR